MFSDLEGRIETALIFTTADIELLRLTAWCKNIPLTSAGQIFSGSEITVLKKLGLLGQTKDGLLRLPPAGIRFLEGLMISYPQDKWYTSKTSVIVRRTQSSALMLTCYRAGFDIFADHPQDIRIPMTYLASVAVRRNRELRGNMLHNTRFSGILYSPQNIRLLYYVAPDAGTIRYVSEMQVFHNMTAQIPAAHSIVYAGASYQALWNILNEPDAPPAGIVRGTHPVSVGKAYRDTGVPVHLLSCDETGAMQLLAMSRVDYRKHLTLAAMGKGFNPPPEGVPDWDGLYHSTPFVMGVDMDLKRIDRAVAAARERGHEKIALAAFKGQHSGLLKQLYKDTGKADLFEISLHTVVQAYDEPVGLFAPPREPFLFQGGMVLA